MDSFGWSGGDSPKVFRLYIASKEAVSMDGSIEIIIVVGDCSICHQWGIALLCHFLVIAPLCQLSVMAHSLADGNKANPVALAPDCIVPPEQEKLEAAKPLLAVGQMDGRSIHVISLN
jgi:hypothetical protein